MPRLVAASIVLILALVLVMNWSQDDIIFPVRAVPAAGPLPAGAERLALETPDRQRLEGIHIRTKGPAQGPRPRLLVLGFGGNAWNAQHVAEYLHELYPQAHVVAFHYRGYRPSTGSPSAKVLIDDAPLVYDRAVERVRPERTVAIGFSIGSGVAASLAGRRKIDGLILVTPFDSLKAVAASIYPWLPVGAFFAHEIDTAKYLEGSRVPVAIVAAEQDKIVPPTRTDALRRKVPNLVFDRTIPRARHNDIYQRSDFQRAMDEALEALPM